MNVLLEKNALNLLLEKECEQELKSLLGDIQRNGLNRQEVITRLLKLTDNYLLFRIWVVLNEYLKVIEPSQPVFETAVYEKIIYGLLSKDEKLVFEAYHNLKNKALF